MTGLGHPMPGISHAQSQIGAAVTAANGDIAATNADANSAVSIANGMVSGAAGTVPGASLRGRVRGPHGRAYRRLTERKQGWGPYWPFASSAARMQYPPDRYVPSVRAQHLEPVQDTGRTTPTSGTTDQPRSV
jgi:hypothetical protein